MMGKNKQSQCLLLARSQKISVFLCLCVFSFFVLLSNQLVFAQGFPAPASAPAPAKTGTAATAAKPAQPTTAAPAAKPAQQTGAPAASTSAPTPSVLTSVPPPRPALPTTPEPQNNPTSNSPATVAPSVGKVFNTTNDMGGDSPKPISIDSNLPPLEQRMSQKITLDVRDMGVVDIFRFLALKGNFNIVVAGNIQGRSTLYLKSVTIKDALDLIVLTNSLGYVVDKDIVRVMSEQEYQSLYGKPFNDQMVVEIIQLKYAKPSYVLSTLDNLKSSLGRIIIDEDTGSVVMIDTKQSIARMRNALADIEKPLDMVAYSLQFAKADVVADKLKARVDAHAVGSITIDERDNKVIVRAYPGRREEVEKLLKDLDTPTKEVLIEARVLQVVFKPQLDVGIDWSLAFPDSKDPYLSKIQFQNVQLNQNSLTSSSNLFAKYFQIGAGTAGIDEFTTAIRALKQVNDTKILSNPKLLVTNNEEAKIHVGDTIPYIISTTSGTGDNAITSEDVRFVDVGLQLSVTPTINDEGFVTMVLKPEISTVVGKITSKGGGIPQINKTSVETTIMIKDGMTVILGGLKKDDKEKSVSGVPGLMNIPFLGKIFTSTSESVETTEIVIFITPHIVSGDKDWDKYKGMIKPAKVLGQKMLTPSTTVSPAPEESPAQVLPVPEAPAGVLQIKS